MILLDTNYLIRFLTNDIKVFAKEAKRIFNNEKEVYLSTLSIAETVYFLGTQYKQGKHSICQQMLNVLHFPNVKTASFISTAIQIYDIENISFYDSVILSEAMARNAELKTLDKKLNKVFLKYSN